MNDSLKSLIRAYADGVITPVQLEELEQALQEDGTAREAFLHEMNLYAGIEDASLATSDTEVDSVEHGDTPRLAPIRVSQWNPINTRWAMLAASIAILALAVTIYMTQSQSPTKIATITGLSGPLLWTGDGGRIVRNLHVGADLSGGTIEGMTPDSWFELEFNDGSMVTIAGSSMLTFSDHGQKVLRLKEGAFSASVQPQPKNKPMLIRTRSALFEVIGTRFNIDAGISASTLTVNEGNVRTTRLSDGATVETTANRRVIVSPDQALLPKLLPDSVHTWKSQLQRGPNRTNGKWFAGIEDQDAQLKAIPYTTDSGKTIFTASFNISTGDNPPVVISPHTRIRVRGRITLKNKVWFGVTLQKTNGNFAGRFQTTRPADQFQNGQPFEVILPLQDYQLDPSLNHVKNKLPSDPSGQTVVSIWCHTLDKQAGLSVTHVEILGPDEQ